MEQDQADKAPEPEEGWAPAERVNDKDSPAARDKAPDGERDAGWDADKAVPEGVVKPAARV